MPINQKKKGNRGEIECSHILEKRFGKGKFKRTPSSGAITGGKNQETTKNLSMESKITLSSDIITPIDFKYIIEHKSYNSANFWDLFNEKSELFKWFEQVNNDSQFVEKEPLLIVKYNYKKRIAYIKEKFPFYIFEIKGWYCYWLENLLTLEDKWWFL